MMGLKSRLKTLARTLSYITYHSPGEFGLFWNRDGSMPWKELYWALQEQPDLRFVRESHVREITLAGIDIPFELMGSEIRLRSGTPVPVYSPVGAVPRVLFHAIPPNQVGVVQQHGLKPFSRPWLRLSEEAAISLRIARRRYHEALLVEVKAMEASLGGVSFLSAGDGLFLVEALPVEYLKLPQVKEREQSNRKKSEKPIAETKRPLPGPGSFFVDPASIGLEGGDKKSVRRGPEWKRESRKERNKRDI